MRDAPTIDRELMHLARRFVAETCEFLTENWNVRREWWPLRHGSGARPAAAACGASVSREPEVLAAAQEVLRAIRVVSVGAGRPDAVDTGLPNAQFFVIIPRTPGPGARGVRIRSVIVEASPPDGDDAPQIWVPETATPPTHAGPPETLPIAGGRPARRPRGHRAGARRAAGCDGR